MSYGGIGEGVNTLDCGSNMRGFESHIPSHKDYKALISRLFLYKNVDCISQSIFYTKTINYL